MDLGDIYLITCIVLSILLIISEILSWTPLKSGSITQLIYNSSISSGNSSASEASVWSD